MGARAGERIGMAAVLALGLGAGGLSAEPLPKDACDALKAEQEALDARGLKDDLAKGAAWGKASLQPQRLKEIQRYIDIEEQLSFRCGYAKARHQKLEEEAAAAAAAAAPPPPKPKAVPKKSAKAKAESGSADAPATGGEPKAKPKPKPRPKAATAASKADDAYRPPQPGKE